MHQHEPFICLQTLITYSYTISQRKRLTIRKLCHKNKSSPKTQSNISDSQSAYFTAKSYDTRKHESVHKSNIRPKKQLIFTTIESTPFDTNQIA